MKEIYKNPVIYYILVPVIAALWPLLVWRWYIPESENNLSTEEKNYKDVQKYIDKILTLDGDRLDFKDVKNKSSEFDYGIAVSKVASLCRIPPVNYKLTSGNPTKSKGQKSQSARVTLEEIDITTFSKFLSELQFRWPNLQCTQAKLTKKKGLPDTWKVNLEFAYYY